jgi:hypothetical protein
MAAAATPVAADCTVNRKLYLAHLHGLLARCRDGVVVFGTKGEELAFGMAERRAVLDDVLEAGIPAERLVIHPERRDRVACPVGTGTPTVFHALTGPTISTPRHKRFQVAY